jgi:hypothetical protein
MGLHAPGSALPPAAKLALRACGVEADTARAYARLRQQGMPSGASFCTGARDAACLSMGRHRGADCAESPPQGRYVLVWQNAHAHYLLITAVVVGIGSSSLCLVGHPLAPLETNVFTVALLQQRTVALPLDSSCSLEQVSVRAVGRSEVLLVVCPQCTLHVPPLLQ